MNAGLDPGSYGGPQSGGTGRTIGSLPRVAITLGDPSGIGPEVVARTLGSPAVRAACRPVIYGTPEVFQAAVSLVGGGRAGSDPVGASTGEAGQGPGAAGCWAGCELVPVDGPLPGQFAFGEASAECGRVSFASLERAARDVLAGKADALSTAPLNKEATAAAGFPDAGHLDFLTRLTGAKETGTVLVAGPLRCLHLTTHRSLAAAVREVRLERVLARLRLAHREMARFGVPNPSIAVCALNPHGGEGGLFGREEIEEISPAVRAARDEGIDARGPFPADSLLASAARGGYDLVLVMYHDQGHIAVKVHDFVRSYTVAFGLPLVRTSVDHGTAFDIAWQGKADARSMIAAIVAAAELAAGRWPDPGKLGAY